jgi:hypothetical protein
MSLLPRLQLKQPTGWFAAGREVAEALTLLPDPAFRLYLYICLNADRHTGRLVIDPAGLARVLARDQTAIEVHLGALVSYGVCHHQAGVLEISDRFWPYQKQLPTRPDNRQADYVRSVRNAFLEPACVCSAFTPADEKLAADLYRRGIPLENLCRAVWLGSARKYMAMLNGQPPASIASLGYFTALLEEVAQAPVTDAYWEHVRHKVKTLERRWQLASSSPAVSAEG